MVVVRFRLIINEGLEIGSQMAYIRRARAAGYAVIVTNTNLNSYEAPRFLRRPAARSIRVNRSSFACAQSNRNLILGQCDS